MNQYLFLFPIEEYFNHVILSTRFHEKGHKIDEFFDIIDARYRDNCEINWLLFSRKDDESKPDMSSVPNYVRIMGNDRILNAGVSFGPGKAANAGGVATSGLEMTQNSMRILWTREKVDEELHKIMTNIHRAAYQASKEYGKPGNYVMGANIAGFLKVAAAMIYQGIY